MCHLVLGCVLTPGTDPQLFRRISGGTSWLHGDPGGVQITRESLRRSSRKVEPRLAAWPSQIDRPQVPETSHRSWGFVALSAGQGPGRIIELNLQVQNHYGVSTKRTFHFWKSTWVCQRDTDTHLEIDGLIRSRLPIIV